MTRRAPHAGVAKLIACVSCSLTFTACTVVISPTLQTPAGISTTPCIVQTVHGTLTSAQVSVRVYNAGTKAGQAKIIREQLQGKGFLVLDIGNKTQDVTETLIIGGKVEAPEVKLVAGFFPQSKIQEDGRTDHTVDVVVNDAFTGLNDTAPTQIDVESVTVC